MHAFLCKFAFVFFAMTISVGASAAEQGATRAEAVAMVKKAVIYIKQNGKEKAFAEFNKPQGQFVDRELYVAVLDMHGLMLAHGANPKLIGKSVIEIKDMNGKTFVREQVELAKTKGTGWVEFEWVNPVSQKMERRATYLERMDDFIVVSGVYKN